MWAGRGFDSAGRMTKGSFKYTLDELFEVGFLWEPEPNSGCWLWVGPGHPLGYGVVSHKGKLRYAHRMAYEHWVSPIPKGCVVCHRCDTPACINPDHLFLGSMKDNSLDMVSKGRHSYGVKHPQARLTDQDVVDMLFMLSCGYSERVIGRSLGHAIRALVSQVVCGKSWRHITGVSRGQNIFEG